MIITLKSAGAPRLRFDRTAVGFVQRLQKALRESVPSGRTLVVTCTAPIRQDSKTSKLLEAELGRLIASRRKKFEATILGNRIQARVLSGGSQAGRLLVFIHNPHPGPEMLFRLTQALIRALEVGARMAAGEVLVIRDQAGRVPVQALEYILKSLKKARQRRL